MMHTTVGFENNCNSFMQFTERWSCERQWQGGRSLRSAAVGGRSCRLALRVETPRHVTPGVEEAGVWLACGRHFAARPHHHPRRQTSLSHPANVTTRSGDHDKSQ